MTHVLASLVECCLPSCRSGCSCWLSLCLIAYSFWLSLWLIAYSFWLSLCSCWRTLADVYEEEMDRREGIHDLEFLLLSRTHSPHGGSANRAHNCHGKHE